MLQHIIDSIRQTSQNLILLFKWMVLSLIIGVSVGAVSTGFAHAMNWVTAFRGEHSWLIYLLPVGGLIIVLIYHMTHYLNDRGTNMVLSSIHSNDQIPYRMAPLVIISTLISHFFGASVGREGAALQLGGSLGSLIGKIVRLDEKDRKVIVMCGMSAAFAALFGTPMAAAIFTLEVIHVGVMYYVALVPCIFSALIASQFAAGMGIHPEAFTILSVPALDIQHVLLASLIAIVVALVSILFCMTLHTSGHYFKEYIRNPYYRIVAGSAIIILITFLLHTTDYMGAGIPVIERAMEGEVEPLAFLLKIILTALAIGCGFKGGEIVPSFFVGATLGCLLGQLLGFDPSCAAAIGMVGMFCCVTNCPISSILIAFELFGYKAVPFFLIVCAIGYYMSGYYGLYKDQMITTSKYKIDSNKEGTV